jgi:hypothetical protein
VEDAGRLADWSSPYGRLGVGENAAGGTPALVLRRRRVLCSPLRRGGRGLGAVCFDDAQRLFRRAGARLKHLLVHALPELRETALRLLVVPGQVVHGGVEGFQRGIGVLTPLLSKIGFIAR